MTNRFVRLEDAHTYASTMKTAEIASTRKRGGVETSEEEVRVKQLQSESWAPSGGWSLPFLRD